jgi:hypothetical protein
MYNAIIQSFRMLGRKRLRSVEVVARCPSYSAGFDDGHLRSHDDRKHDNGSWCFYQVMCVSFVLRS